MDLGIKKKWALVTGGSHGVGLASAISLAQEGCNVICASRDADKLAVVRKKILSLESECMTFTFDALQVNSINTLFSDIEETGVSPDILVNNVGGGGRWGSENILANSSDVWDEVLQKNYQCSRNLTLRALPRMQERGWGRVICVTSIYGLMGEEDLGSILRKPHKLC